MSAKPHLQSLIFEVTQRCNHACLHCYNVWQGEPPSPPIHYPRGELNTTQTLQLLAKALEETDCHHVTLTGGEPLLRADLPILLDFLRERYIQSTIISNGRLLNEQTAISLIDHGVALFELPLLSHQREIHDRLSATPGAWDSVLAAMTRVRLHHGRVITAFVATRVNIGHLYETIKLAFAFGARAIMFNRFNPGGRGRKYLHELLPSIEQVREALSVAESASAEFGIPISCSIPIQPCLIDTSAFPRLRFGYCAAGSERAYYTLDPVGNVRPCNHSTTILGNLFEESFGALVSPERMKGFVNAFPAKCTACKQLAICQGGCKAAGQVCYGSLDSMEPFLQQGQSI
ncbi:MAG: radical SAM protein [Chloroflexi bacterium]|nr:radical SAM protein [Chloroflexota bacterium]